MRTLVIEDEPTVAAAVRAGLVSDGYAVDIARDGQEGLWYATEHAYDAIILDLMLPEIDGFEVCRQLRASNAWSPILVLTARQGTADEATALDLGADDDLTKPFSMIVLKARIRALTRRRYGPRPSVMKVGVIELDPASRTCKVDGSAKDLTTREFSVLEYLVRNAGTVVSKLDVLDNVWDYNFEGDPNIVEVYVRRLRKKLELPIRDTTIVTVRGAGYRLEGGA